MKRNRMTHEEKEKSIKSAMIRNVLSYHKCFKEHLEFFMSKTCYELLSWVHPIDRIDFKEQLRKLETCNN